MARKKDLGGLAALAGLAYMASRDKAVKGDVPVEERTAPSAGDVDTGMSEKEPGWESGAAPAAPAARSTGRRASAPAGGGLENARDALIMRRGQVPSTTEAGMRNYVPRRSAAQQIAGRDDTYNPDVAYRTRTENKDVSDMAYKKGGSVKGWGSARGARKAKIY